MANVAGASEQEAEAMGLVFSTEAVHTRDRLDYWLSAASKAFVEHKFETPVGRAFRGVIRGTSVGTVKLSSFQCDEASVSHTKRCVRRLADDDLIVARQVRGKGVLHQDGRTAVLANPGDLVLLDPRRPFTSDVGPNHQSLTIKVPRQEMEARLGDLSSVTARAICVDQPIVSLASGFFDMLAQRATSLEGLAATKVGDQAIDLLALAVRSQVQEGAFALSSPRSATLLRLKAAIEERLCDPTLKPASAAAATGISIRYANALLADEDTSLERYIMSRRLENCYQALTAPTHISRTVSDVAYAWGFSDVSHFTRRFKARFGCSPGECRLRNGKSSD